MADVDVPMTDAPASGGTPEEAASAGQEQPLLVPQERNIELEKKNAINDAVTRFGATDPVTKYLVASDTLRDQEGSLVNDIANYHNRQEYQSVYNLLTIWAKLRVYVIEMYGLPLSLLKDKTLFNQLVTTIQESENWRLHVATFDPEGTKRLEAKKIDIKPSERAPTGETPDEKRTREAAIARFRSQELAAERLLEVRAPTQQRQQAFSESDVVSDPGTSGQPVQIPVSTGTVSPSVTESQEEEVKKGGKRGGEKIDTPSKKAGSESTGVPPPPSITVPKKPAPKQQRPGLRQSSTTKQKKSEIGSDDEDEIELVELSLDGIDISDHVKIIDDDDEDDLGEWIPASGTDKEK